jgi:hypothetical protein
MMPFYCRRWDERCGDRYDDWGAAVYYFWVHEGVIEQQVEIYDAGVMLAYDRYHTEDAFGVLSQEWLDANEWAPFEIDIDRYQREVDGQPYNRPS